MSLAPQLAGPPPVYDSARRPHPFVEELRELVRYRELAITWALRTVKLRYKRSVLGVLWTLLEPLMLMTILSVVFSHLFRFELERGNYPVYVLTGLLMYDFFNRSTTSMVDEILESQNLAKRIYIPRSAFALAAIITYLINWGLALIPLVAIMVLLGHPFSWALLTVPPAIFLVACFTMGVGLIVATLAAFFHDINITFQVILTGWLYATPIIYPLWVVQPEWLQGVLLFNPLLHLLRLLQAAIYDGVVASAATWGISAALALCALLVGWWSFTRWRDAFDYRT